MNKRVMIAVVVIVLVIIAVAAYVFLKPKAAAPAVQTVPEKTTQNTPKEQAVQPKGEYVAYSPERVSQTEGTKILFFHASWCPQCRELDTSIKASAIPSGVTIFKVNYDSNQTLRQKYGVTLQTTCVKIDNEGNKVASYVAYESPDFASVERALLP